MTLADIRIAGSLTAIPRVGRGEVNYLWVSEVWDGPLSGMLEWNGANYWFEMFAENESENPTWSRRFAVLRLTGELMEGALERHANFQRYVGTHYDCGESVEPKGLKPPENWHKFYDKYLPQSFEACDVVAWYEH
jgi:hypothetical protein